MMAVDDVATDETTRADTGKTARELLAEAMALLELVAQRLEQEYPGLQPLPRRREAARCLRVAGRCAWQKRK